MNQQQNNKTPSRTGKGKSNTSDLVFRFIGIPFIAVMSHVIFFNEKAGSSDDRFSWLEVILISIAEAIALWEANRIVLFYFRRRLPSLHQSVQRIAWQMLICTLVTIITRYLNVLIYSKTLFWGYPFSLEAYLYNIYVGLLYVVIVAGIYESIYYFQQWKTLFAEKEALQRANLQSQLDALKTQISPHFLFNNLSSLASLIMEDQAQAVTFVKQLSSVYRYLLQASEKDLIPLKNELEFCEDYYHLLRTRFGSGLNLSIKVNDDCLHKLLPPLTIQTVLENAVKHNSILPGSPLKMKLFSNETSGLTFENNIQKKHAPVISHSTGLKNIQRKYELLHGSAIKIIEADNMFTVIVPLIDAVYENTDY